MARSIHSGNTGVLGHRVGAVVGPASRSGLLPIQSQGSRSHSGVPACTRRDVFSRPR